MNPVAELKERKRRRTREVEPTEIVTQVCDESKCVSKGSSALDDHFTCYGDDGTFYPMMCADGFLPRVVEDEPPLIDEKEGIPLSYFTCCPPEHLASESTKAERHCSDPYVVEDDEGFETICEDEGNREHPRRMKSGGEESDHETFVCCDSATTADAYDSGDYNENNTAIATSFLDDAECVPYRNEFYDASKVKNQWGRIYLRSCDFPERDFQIPRTVGDGTVNNTTTTMGLYQCCRSGEALDPYLEDRGFKTTLYPALFLSAIAIVTSAIVVVGLLTPLLIQLKDGTFQTESERSRRRRPKRTSKFLTSSKDALRGSFEYLKNKTRRSEEAMRPSNSVPSRESTLGSGKLRSSIFTMFGKYSSSNYNSSVVSKHPSSSIYAAPLDSRSMSKPRSVFGSERQSSMANVTESGSISKPRSMLDSGRQSSMVNVTESGSISRPRSMVGSERQSSMIKVAGSFRKKRISPSQGRLESQISKISDHGSAVWCVTAQRSAKVKLQAPCYSTYNLYMVYLALTDFVYNVFIIWVYGDISHQKFDPNLYSYVIAISNDIEPRYSLEWPMSIWFLNANLWVNALMARQVLLLLKASLRARKINPPSLKRVNLEVAAVFTFASILGIIDYIIRDQAWKANVNGNERRRKMLLMFLPFFCTFCGMVPVAYVCYLAFLIWRKGYIPPLDGISAKGKAMRQLAIYFCRIIAVFLFCWMPGFFTANISQFMGSSWGFANCTLNGAIQSILSFGLILTKSDVQKYIWDLVTLSYIFDNCHCCRKPMDPRVSAYEMDQCQQKISEEIEFQSSSGVSVTARDESGTQKLFSTYLSTDPRQDSSCPLEQTRISVGGFDCDVTKKAISECDFESASCSSAEEEEVRNSVDEGAEDNDEDSVDADANAKDKADADVEANMDADENGDADALTLTS